MKIYIGADHKGFQLKESLKKWLVENGFDHEDVGAQELYKGDDYPIYASNVAEKVSNSLEKAEDARGIVICGSGVGVDIVANKFDGVRSGLGINSDQVASARRDDNINVLALAADVVDEKSAKELAHAFLVTEFQESDRRVRRLEEIKEIENHK